ncbi:DUF4381 domain-containing protein [Thalassotalea psychrophila]|uniref:DUF4381 domain-containing protein n=1 Tax=Thalassotalea psychrophila TaxID=3065647 RepID=A0ABY9TY98_9GAMM|nr:DUF4381 domain-containing protein [Colwelliaceae bacterium SQ149]
MAEALTNTITPNNSNPLLKDFSEISAPVDINWWPQTLGWQIILLIFICYLLYRIYLVFKRYVSNAYRRGALLQLAQLGNEKEDIKLIPQLLRSTALYAYERKVISPLLGANWEQWLDSQCKNAKFHSQFSGVLNNLAYSPEVDLEPQQLIAFKQQVAHWIANHRGMYD